MDLEGSLSLTGMSHIFLLIKSLCSYASSRTPPGPSAPQPPQPPPEGPPIPDFAEPPVRPAWRPYFPRGRKKKKEPKVAPAAQQSQAGPSNDRHLRQQVTRSWSTWHRRFLFIHEVQVLNFAFS